MASELIDKQLRSETYNSVDYEHSGLAWLDATAGFKVISYPIEAYTASATVKFKLYLIDINVAIIYFLFYSKLQHS